MFSHTRHLIGTVNDPSGSIEGLSGLRSYIRIKSPLTKSLTSKAFPNHLHCRLHFNIPAEISGGSMANARQGGIIPCRSRDAHLWCKADKRWRLVVMSFQLISHTLNLVIHCRQRICRSLLTTTLLVIILLRVFQIDCRMAGGFELEEECLVISRG